MALLKQEKYGAAEVDCDAALELDPSYVKVGLVCFSFRSFLLSYMSVLNVCPESLYVCPICLFYIRLSYVSVLYVSLICLSYMSVLYTFFFL